MNKIAIIYDWIDSWGGVERVLLHLHELYPDAIFYTSYYDSKKAPWAKKLNIQTSFIQNFPQFIKNNRVFALPFFPYAFESFNLSQYDVVISVSSAFAKSVVTKPHTKHICYLLTPPRYLWGMTDVYLRFQTYAGFVLKWLRNWDYISAQRPDMYISISQTVADRCHKYYHRSSKVLFPPFDQTYWKQFKKETIPYEEKDYYLVVSRLEPYKKVNLVIEAFNGNPERKLIVVGKGTQKESLQVSAKSNITFYDSVHDQELARLYSHAKALIMPQEEDFGYVSLEAQFFGCPVIAFRSGGVTETVIENESGIFFDYQSKESLQGALERFEMVAYNVHSRIRTIINHLDTFSEQKFNSFFKEITRLN